MAVIVTVTGNINTTCGKCTELFNAKVGHMDIAAIVTDALCSPTINKNSANRLWNVC